MGSSLKVLVTGAAGNIFYYSCHSIFFLIAFTSKNTWTKEKGNPQNHLERLLGGCFLQTVEIFILIAFLIINRPCLVLLCLVMEVFV